VTWSSSATANHDGSHEVSSARLPNQYPDPMLRLLADTCVWLDLAKNVNGEPLIAACRQLVHEERLELLVPQIVIDEFERNRGRIEADMARSVSATFHRVRAAVDEYGRGDGRDEAIKQLDELTHRVPLINQMAIGQFSQILELLRAGRTLQPSAEATQRAVQRALDKRAPFHRSKNSVADALILEMYVEVCAADASGRDDHCFVTTNVKDFSLSNGDTRLAHADLADCFAAPKSQYFTSLAAAVTAYFPDDVDELMAELIYYDEPRGLSEIQPVISKLLDQVWYNRHKNLAYKIEVGDVTLVDKYSLKDHQHTVVRRVWEGALASARRLEEQWPGELGPWDDFEWGMLNGKLSALRWALGDDWEVTLDT
jgi:PIN domain